MQIRITHNANGAPQTITSEVYERICIMGEEDGDVHFYVTEACNCTVSCGDNGDNCYDTDFCDCCDEEECETDHDDCTCVESYDCGGDGDHYQTMYANDLFRGEYAYQYFNVDMLVRIDFL